MNYITNEVQDNQQRGLLSAMFGDSRKMGLDTTSLTSFIEYASTNKQRDKLIIGAFKYFVTTIKEKIDKTSKPEEYLRNLRDAILNISYVSIIANSDEDAYTIFEILNARGLPLADHELLKNYIMRFIQPQSSRDTAKATWVGIENLLNNNISKFVEHYATHKYGSKRGESKYKIIQNANKGKDTTELLYDIERKAYYYSKLVYPTEGDEGNCTDLEYRIYSFFNRKRQVHMRPVLLSLIHKRDEGILSEQRYNGIITFLYLFYVCYNVIGEESSNKLTNSIYKYAEKLENDFSNDLVDEFVADLKKKMPNKETFINAFKNVGWSHHGGFYSGDKNKDRVQTVLEIIEQYKNQSTGKMQFTIEHVLPDSDSSNNGKIGNLIPLEESLNKKGSKIQYKRGNEEEYLLKKKSIYEQSIFIMAKNMSKYIEKGKFDIDKRTELLGELFYENILEC